MKFFKYKVILPAVFMAVSATAGYCSTNAASDANALPLSLSTKVQSFKANLEASGYEVLRGNWNLFTIDDCKYAVAKMGNCFGNNPASPYVIPTVPLWPDEFVDHYMKDAIGPTQGNTWWTHRFDEREAVVVLGLLPPPGGYFGIQSYVFTRQGTINTNDEIYKSLTDEFMKSILFMPSPNPSRIMVFSSLGDSNNNVTIQRQSGASWEQERYFIITPDAVMERKVTEALLKAGVNDRKQIFTEPVSKDLAHLGLGSSADDFMTIIRYSMPYDEVMGERWRRSLPIAVFRVREKNSTRPVEPYPAPVREARTARPELELQGDLDNLVKAVKQQWGQADVPDSRSQSLLLWVDLVGDHCLKRPMNCLGDNSDADYQVSKTVSVDEGNVIAAVGVLGTATGNANYVSLSVNWLPPLVGVINRSNDDLAGSAGAFSSTVANTDKLYVQYFARNCTGIPNCTTVSEAAVPRGDWIKIIQRNYVVPGTTRGADPTQLVNPTIIVFKPKS
ncbi:MAG: hypothetical protein ACXVCE_10225 [Bacteriovorax sp.]